MFITKMQQSDVIYTFIHHEGSIKQRRTRNVGQCPTWWSPCRI